MSEGSYNIREEDRVNIKKANSVRYFINKHMMRRSVQDTKVKLRQSWPHQVPTMMWQSPHRCLS